MLKSLTLLVLAGAASAQSLPNLQHVRAAHPWAMRYGDPARTGRSPYPGARLGVEDWKFQIAGAVPSFAVARDGTVHCGTVFHEEWWSNESFVYALTPAGTLEWRAKVLPWDWGASQGVGGGPALDRLERVLVPSAHGRLYQFAPDGTILWHFEGTVGATHESSPAVLVDASIRHYMLLEGVVALDKVGTLLFQGNGWTGSSSVAVAANGEMALSGVKSNEPHGSIAIQYFNANGSLRWSRSTLFGEDSTPVIGDDGTIYAQYEGTSAFTPDNRILWTIGGATSRALGRNGILYLAGGTTIRLVDAASGSPLSTILLPGGANEGLAIDVAGNLFATTSNGFVCKYTASGAKVFEKKICDSFTTGPAIATDARVVAAGKQGFIQFVYSIR